MSFDVQALGVGVAIFVAAFTQAITGFGAALVGMPLLSQMIGVRLGAPVMAMVSLPMNVTLLLVQRRAFRWGEVWKLIVAALVAVPLGILTVGALSERVVLIGLGVLLVGYALYAWITPHLPELAHPLWSYFFGFCSGILAGGYNVGGPPAVIYGECKRWNASEFRSNLQALFLLENVFVIAGHLVRQDFTADVLHLLWFALPGLGVGIAAGLILDRFIPDALFGKIVLVFLFVLGAKLILG